LIVSGRDIPEAVKIPLYDQKKGLSIDVYNGDRIMTTRHPVFYAVNRYGHSTRQDLIERFRQAVDNWYVAHNLPQADRIPHCYDYIVSWWLTRPFVVLFPTGLRITECDYLDIKEQAVKDGVDIISLDEGYLGEL